MHRALRGFYPDNSLSLTTKPSDGTPFNKMCSMRYRPLRISQSNPRCLHIALIGRQQCSLDGLWQQWLNFPCAASLYPFKPWEKVLLFVQERFQPANPLPIKTPTQPGNLNNPHLHALPFLPSLTP